MIQRILFFILLSVAYQSVTAQDVAGCTYLLEDAKEAYGAGMVELIPDLLLPCLGQDGLTGGPRREAYKLVINSYLFDHMPQEAEQLMVRFVDEYPSYRAGDTDPAEFVLLLNTQLLSRGIDPEDVEEYVAESDSVRQRTRRPKREKILGVDGHSLGFQVGSSATLPQVLERYSLGDPGQDQGQSGILPGFQLGAVVNFLIDERFDISSALLFNQSRFKYSGSPLSNSSYVYKENGSYFQLPVSLIWKLNPESQGLSYYLRGGIVGEYLLATSGQGTRTDSPSGSEFVVEKTDISIWRRQINLSAMAGVGLRYPLNRSFFFAEARFTYGILQANKPENRYQNTDLNWTLYYVDSDFRKHQVSLCAGICWSISKMEEP